MSTPQPEYVWAFPPEKPKRGRLGLIVLLSVLAVAIAVGVFLLFLRPWATAAPGSTPTPSASASSPTPTASATPTTTPTPSVTPTATPTPTSTPSATPEPPAPTRPPQTDPSLTVFRDKVQPRLDDAATGLSYARESSGAEGTQLVDQLRGDAGWMADAVAPQSIATQWHERVEAYGRALDRLHGAFANGTAIAGPLADAESALDALTAVLRG